MGGVSMADQKLIKEVGKYIDKYYEPEKDDIKIDKEMLSIFEQITRFRKKGRNKKFCGKKYSIQTVSQRKFQKNLMFPLCRRQR